jgi:PBP1b-binding outer membrane lipoprotein LpoB
MKTKIKQITIVILMGLFLLSCKKNNDAISDKIKADLEVVTKDGDLITIDLTTTKAKYEVTAKTPKNFKATDGKNNEVKIGNGKIGIIMNSFKLF